MRISPFFSSRPWAGTRMQSLFPAAPQGTGEAWLLSTLEGGESTVNGKNLSDVLGKRLTCLVKVIDTQAPLSVQVHPNDEWAGKLENSRGKTECWLILAADPGCGVFLGVKDGVTSEAFAQALVENQDVSLLLNFFPVTPGDFISVPAGTIHAIGRGVTLLEVQQASGITYRLWDWNRKGRELHTEKGMRVADFSKKPSPMKAGDGPLFKHTDFEVFQNEMSGDGWVISLQDFSVGKTANVPYLFVR